MDDARAAHDPRAEPPEAVARLEYAPVLEPPRPDVPLVVASALFFLLLMLIAMNAAQWVASTQGALLFDVGGKMGAMALIGILCQALSLFGRSRTATGAVFYFAAGIALTAFLLSAVEQPRLYIRLICGAAALVCGFTSWRYSRWGRQLRAWKWSRDRSQVLPQD